MTELRMANASQRNIRSLSLNTIRCQKCGLDFDPRVQSAACHKKVRHYPIVRTSEWQQPPPAADKPRRRAPFQSDFMLLWDETQPYPRAPK
jgi:hypothetical protein